jgi:hypothetical protein
MTIRLSTTFAVAALASLAYGGTPEGVPWTASNVAELQALDRTAIEQFVNRVAGDDVQHATVGEFAWTDLAGDGRYELVVTADTTGRSFFDRLDVYRRDARGDVQVQSILGVGIRELATVIRDLDGDGKKELIVPSRLESQGPGGPLNPTVVWPKVYRLRNAQYVDASRDFPTFYDEEIIPGVDASIEQARRKVADQREPALPPAGDPHFVQREAEARLPQRQLAAQVMTRDKILRVLGRDPSAGLDAAREWTKSADPYVVANAVVVLRDMGGHKDELRAAEEAQRAAVERERALH